ncbi:O-methyltransferase [Gordonia sp. X0973]|uniref:O-methyltransferase n=1 Tax=Gordonia sp. X0973 TaxID=2742602 RepID=UPI000F53E8E1|nr:O-methyltransferase [Gordonia sp. X0973]QKT07865.1 O-methyltransferase [Gordonia sp. X0973]
MDAQRWARTDDYLERTVADDATGFDFIRRAQADAGLPDIAVSPTQGKFLYLLARIARARRILEIGTLGGYSTAWLAKAVGADGLVVTLEYERAHAEVAGASLAKAGLIDRVDIRVGAALDLLDSVTGPFDLVFIDADKANNPNYLTQALRLTGPGAVIVVDNVVRRIDEDGPDADGTRRALEMLGSDPRLDATALQTVGVKGWDGFAVAVVK